jgi:hypothetical protein
MGRDTSSEPPLKVPYRVPLARFFLLVPLHDSFAPTPPLRFRFFDSFNLIRSSREMHSDSSLPFTYHASVHCLPFIRFDMFPLSHSLRFMSSGNLFALCSPRSSSSLSTVHSLRILCFCSLSSIHSIRFVRFESFTSFHLLGPSLRFVLFVTFSSFDPNLIHICRYTRDITGVVADGSRNQWRLLDH